MALRGAFMSEYKIYLDDSYWDSKKALCGRDKNLDHAVSNTEQQIYNNDFTNGLNFEALQGVATG